MSLEFPLEKRKIGKFYLELWDSDIKMVDYYSYEKSDIVDLHKTIIEGLPKYNLIVVDGFDWVDSKYGDLYFEDFDVEFSVTLYGWSGTGVLVRVEKEKTTKWRANFKDALGELEKILEKY